MLVRSVDLAIVAGLEQHDPPVQRPRRGFHAFDNGAGRRIVGIDEMGDDGDFRQQLVQ